MPRLLEGLEQLAELGLAAVGLGSRRVDDPANQRRAAHDDGEAAEERNDVDDADDQRHDEKSARIPENDANRFRQPVETIARIDLAEAHAILPKPPIGPFPKPNALKAPSQIVTIGIGAIYLAGLQTVTLIH